MFSKLVFFIDDMKIEFHLHELVKIAQQIIDNIQGAKVVIPSEGMYQQIVSTVLKDKEDQNIINGSLDPFLFIPMLITGMNSIEKWIYVARQ